MTGGPEPADFARQGTGALFLLLAVAGHLQLISIGQLEVR